MPLPEGWVDLIGNVPPIGTDGACTICHGVANKGWTTCFKCARRWSLQPGFDRIRLVVPCSVVVGGSDWYRAVYTYKAGSFDAYAEVLSSVLSVWLSRNGRRVTTALGSRPTFVTVVPSRRVEHPTPLWEVVSALPELRPILRRLLRYRPGAVRPPSRDIVITDHFEVLENVDDGVVVLFEDTWVSGQTPVGAALALIQAGAVAVAVVPIARMVYPDTPSATYQAATKAPYTASWPK